MCYGKEDEVVGIIMALPNCTIMVQNMLEGAASNCTAGPQIGLANWSPYPGVHERVEAICSLKYSPMSTSKAFEIQERGPLPAKISMSWGMFWTLSATGLRVKVTLLP